MIKTEINRQSAVPYIARLRWLMRLRWLALLGVSGGSTIAVLGLVTGINRPIVTLAIVIGVASNAYIQWKISHRETVDIEGLHVHQALLDIVVLSLVLWASGGSACPFIGFYTFPVLLAALLSGKRTFWPTAIASITGLGWQVLSAHYPPLQVGQWNPSPAWGELLSLAATTITIGMAAYFAARFTDTLKVQVQARHAADELLQLTFDRLEAGLELIEGERVIWQNSHALETLGERVGSRWSCPGSKRATSGSTCPMSGTGCKGDNLDAPIRCQFSLGAAHAQGAKIYEVMLLSPSKQLQRVALYVERTAEVTYQQRLMHTERLASLGRAAQGVAHELNTPLATIQTLSRDLFDALSFAELTTSVREDVEESAGLIIDEVQRCRRITHGLLGRADRRQGGVSPLEEVLRRAVALVFPHHKERVALELSGLGELRFPRDPITQIFVNLLQNALDASQEPRASEGPDVVITAVTLLRDAEPHLMGGEGVELSVRDHGVGLSPESRQLIFEPFYTTKSKGEGTGLGLYTSYALARELGGVLSIDNHPEGGVIATLWLPNAQGVGPLNEL